MRELGGEPRLADGKVPTFCRVVYPRSFGSTVCKGCVLDTVYITPPGAIFEGRLLDNQEGATSVTYRTIRARLRKALGEMISTPTFFVTDTGATVPTVEISSLEPRPGGV